MAVHNQILKSFNRKEILKPSNSLYRECECLDAPEPTTQAPTTVGPVNNGTCNAGWIADNYCDDINNNPECEFDGGDCCQEDPAEGWNNYCE